MDKGSPWTDEEKEYVKQNYKKLTTKEIAGNLNRTVNAIITIVGPLGVSSGRSRPWSDDEKKYLQSNYGKVPNEKLADELGRTVKAILAAAAKFGFTKKRKRI